MTTTVTETIDRKDPGWLRRTWTRGLTHAQRSGPSYTGAEAGFLLKDRVPEALEPFVSARPAAGLEEHDTRILDFHGLDGPAAQVLLKALPDCALDLDYTGYAPPAGTLLQSVLDHPGVVVTGGRLVAPELSTEALLVREVTILDPTLVDVPPDVVPDELPVWIEELPATDRAEYLSARANCLGHGRTREAWVAAVGRYGITEARRFPYTQIVTDDEDGILGVWFAW